MHQAWAEINLNNITYNLNELKQFLDDKTGIMAMIKANAYGHGAVEIAKVLQNNGVKSFGVATCDEGILLRNNGISLPIMIIANSLRERFGDIVDHGLTQTVSDINTAVEISQTAQKKNKQTTIEIMIDTGMGRLGFEPNLESVNTIIEISKLPFITISGVYSHLAMAESLDTNFSKEQFAKFLLVANALKEKGFTDFTSHICGSGGILNNIEMHLDMVRPGIIIYGIYPSPETARHIDLKPSMSLKAKISHIAHIKKGDSIGYERAFVAPRDTVAAILNIGYADGYPSALTNKGKVIVGGEFAPVVGQICMDQTIIDITDIKNVAVEDTVILFGKQGDRQITAEEVAELSESKSREILAMSNIGPRIPRVYIGSH